MKTFPVYMYICTGLFIDNTNIYHVYVEINVHM